MKTQMTFRGNNSMTPFQLVKRFLKNNSGTSMIEFALVAPFMITMLLFTIVANDSVNSSSEIGKVTAAVSDILSQSETITPEVIDATFDVADILVNSTRHANLELYVTGIEVFADGSTEVSWSRDNGNLSSLSKPSPGSSYPLPAELLARAGFIVSARARLSHVTALSKSGLAVGQGAPLPFIGKILPGMGNMVYDYENHFAPRVSISTDCDDCDN